MSMFWQPDDINLTVFGVDEVNVSQTTTSASYVDLATVGPVVTLNCGATAMAWVACNLSNSGANLCIVSVAVSGATTRAASDDYALAPVAVSGFQGQFGTVLVFEGLTPGSNTFTMKYRTTGGTATFTRRQMSVLGSVA